MVSEAVELQRKQAFEKEKLALQARLRNKEFANTRTADERRILFLNKRLSKINRNLREFSLARQTGKSIVEVRKEQRGRAAKQRREDLRADAERGDTEAQAKLDRLESQRAKKFQTTTASLTRKTGRPVRGQEVVTLGVPAPALIGFPQRQEYISTPGLTPVSQEESTSKTFSDILTPKGSDIRRTVVLRETRDIRRQQQEEQLAPIRELEAFEQRISARQEARLERTGRVSSLARFLTGGGETAIADTKIGKIRIPLFSVDSTKERGFIGSVGEQTLANFLSPADLGATVFGTVEKLELSRRSFRLGNQDVVKQEFVSAAGTTAELFNPTTSEGRVRIASSVLTAGTSAFFIASSIQQARLNQQLQQGSVSRFSTDGGTTQGLTIFGRGKNALKVDFKIIKSDIKNVGDTSSGNLALTTNVKGVSQTQQGTFQSSLTTGSGSSATNLPGSFSSSQLVTFRTASIRDFSIIRSDALAGSSTLSRTTPFFRGVNVRESSFIGNIKGNQAFIKGTGFSEVPQSSFFNIGKSGQLSLGAGFRSSTGTGGTGGAGFSSNVPSPTSVVSSPAPPSVSVPPSSFLSSPSTLLQGVLTRPVTGSSFGFVSGSSVNNVGSSSSSVSFPSPAPSFEPISRPREQETLKPVSIAVPKEVFSPSSFVSSGGLPSSPSGGRSGFISRGKIDNPIVPDFGIGNPPQTIPEPVSPPAAVPDVPDTIIGRPETPPNIDFFPRTPFRGKPFIPIIPFKPSLPSGFSFGLGGRSIGSLRGERFAPSFSVLLGFAEGNPLARKAPILTGLEFRI